MMCSWWNCDSWISPHQNCPMWTPCAPAIDPTPINRQRRNYGIQKFPNNPLSTPRKKPLLFVLWLFRNKTLKTQISKSHIHFCTESAQCFCESPCSSFPSTLIPYSRSQSVLISYWLSDVTWQAAHCVTFTTPGCSSLGSSEGGMQMDMIVFAR